MNRLTSNDLRGVLPPVLTPFSEDGSINFQAFVHNIERWNKTPLSGYLFLGSNSETAYLNEQEKIELLKRAKELIPANRVFLVGTGLESTQETIRFTNIAAGTGAQAALVLTPSYYIDQMNDSALVKHFTILADASDIPILLYNVPKHTHLNISANVVKTISTHPNIIGMKDSSGDCSQLETFLSVADANFTVLVGTAAAWYPALELGIKGGIMALATIAPNECTEIQSMFNSESQQQARTLFERLLPVNTAVTATYGVAGLKYAADILGYMGGFVRSPLLPLDQESKSRIKKILCDAGLGN
jgi:4-hydroxy-2-oxoglutarate aldolase